MSTWLLIQATINVGSALQLNIFIPYVPIAETYLYAVYLRAARKAGDRVLVALTAAVWFAAASRRRVYNNPSAPNLAIAGDRARRQHPRRRCRLHALNASLLALNWGPSSAAPTLCYVINIHTRYQFVRLFLGDFRHSLRYKFIKQNRYVHTYYTRIGVSNFWCRSTSLTLQMWNNNETVRLEKEITWFRIENYDDFNFKIKLEGTELIQQL